MKRGGREEEEEKGSKWDILLTFAWGLCILLAIALLVVLLLLLALYVGRADQKEDDLDHQRTLHADQVRTAEQSVAWTGRPWYEVMQINDLCLKRRILKYEIHRGLRPASSVA